MSFGLYLTQILERTLHNPREWTNHCSFELHNCKSSNLCCCSTHFSYKWEQLGGKIISHVTPFKKNFFCKRPFVGKIIQCNCLIMLATFWKKSWVTCILINIKLEISIIWVNPKSWQQFHFNLEFAETQNTDLYSNLNTESKILTQNTDWKYWLKILT